MEAVQRVRETKGRSAEPRSLFTTFEGYTAPEIRLTAELIVDRNVQDDFGVHAKAAISTLRYEVAFGVRTEDGVERLVLTEEKLDPIPLHDAQDVFAFPKQKSFVKSCISGRRVVPFISTNTEGSEPEIRVHQEGHGGRRVNAPKSARTVISGMASSDYPTILAAHREMQSWQTLLLEPSAMRALSQYQDARFIDSRGGNLPGTIFRLQKNEKNAGSTYTELANRLAELIEDVHELQVRDDPKTETLTLEVKGRNGVFHPARSLSDGTLRFLVLATLAQDPLARGIICLEEPENGIHPERIHAMVRLLKDIATDTKYAVGPGNPLRQVIVNTHSSEVVRNVSPEEDFVYVDEERTRVGHVNGRVASILVPPGSWREKAPAAKGRLMPTKVWAYLGLEPPTEYKQMWLALADSGPANQ